jgi:hypothetical protein
MKIKIKIVKFAKKFNKTGPYLVFSTLSFASYEFIEIFRQGIITEGEGSVQLTSSLR